MNNKEFKKNIVPEPDYNYLSKLNPQQREAISYNEGPSLVIAGPGSGKTRVLTYKVVNLINRGYDPERILILTFTNKAAREMKERIQHNLGHFVSNRLKMGTFHSVFLKILRTNAEKIGYKPGFTIYDTSDSKALIKMIVKEMGLDEKKYKASTLQSIISNEKNALVSPENYINDKSNYQADDRAKRPLTGEIYRLYCERCRIANAMDFDDILLNMNLLLRDNEEIRSYYQNYFQYILIDEYQDTNFAQHVIISVLGEKNKKLFIVGDDAQSIYSFRGANINNILTLELKLNGLKTFKLERNYRSTQTIINAAASLIEKNTRQLSKQIYSENQAGNKIPIYKGLDDREEASIVAGLISQSRHSFHDSYDDYAILYRTNAQSRLLEEYLRKNAIPYKIYGGLSFYQRKEVKDMIAYFKLSVNPNDDEALKRIINYPARGIGETTVKKLTAIAHETKQSIWEVITTMNLKERGFNNGTINKIAGFITLISEFINENNSGKDAYEVGEIIFNKTGIISGLAYENTPESISKKENLFEILSALKNFVQQINSENEGIIPELQSFLSEVMLLTDQDIEEDIKQPKVTLMTVHAAKGLEFKHIFITGLEENLFPSILESQINPLKNLEEIEEERRLLYVAITRAKETCNLSYAESRFRNGKTVQSNPSRFINEINPAYLDRKDFPYNSHVYGMADTTDNSIGNRSEGNYSFKTSKYNNSLISSSDKILNLNKLADSLTKKGFTPSHSVDELRIGTIIKHPNFGKGEIIQISEMSGNDVILVDFGKEGKKKLLLKFAKFDILT